VKLLRLKGKNFRSFAEFDLDLNAVGLFSVTGPNGAGKSSIFSAVEWALFGGKRGPNTPSVLRQGAEEGAQCRVEVEFEVAGRVLEVVRIDRKDAWLTDVETGRELSRGLTHTSNEVAVQLGLSQDMFLGTFYARQKEVQALSSSKSLGDRRDQLELLLGIEHLRRASDIAARDAREQKALVSALAEDAPDVDELRADIERCEREAREAAPMIGRLEARVVELDTALKEATSHIDVLAEQLSEHKTRSVAAEQADAELKREQVILSGLCERLDAAKAAQVELSELEPVAARVDEVTALEREMDMRRRNHEQVEQLRAQERRALEELALATDMLRELRDASDDEDPTHRLAVAQDELTAIAEQLRSCSEVRQETDHLLRDAHDEHERAQTAARLDTALAELIDAEALVESTREQWQDARGRKAELRARLDHEIKHRDALLGVGDDEAPECPTCHQPLDGTLSDLVGEYEGTIAAIEQQLTATESEMEGLEGAGKKQKASADRAVQLRAQRAALGNVGQLEELAATEAQAETSARTAAYEELQLEEQYRRLVDILPELRMKAEQAEIVAIKRTETHERQARAEHQAATYAEQLRQAGGNSYDSTAHENLRTALDRAQAAVRRCAVLREGAASIQLLERRIAKQRPLVDTLGTRVAQLRAAAAELEVTDDARGQATRQRDDLDEALRDARQELDRANQRVSVESVAVSAAHARLADGQKAHKRLDREQVELTIRAAVAKALSDYREHASQRARPALEEEASNMLKQVTGGTYPVIRLTEAYLLEVADAGQMHPLRRFSGGEQDLAALCLRLALSRTLARQRGAEHGFVILDEVFGSQDQGRRQQLLDQLAELAHNEFHQIFVISHTDDVIESCQLHIKVQRNDDGVSMADGPTVGA
jgi:exonuclease SbcC